MREFIIQWNGGWVDLYEYTKEHEVQLVLCQVYGTDIIDCLSEINEEIFVHIEQCSIYLCLHSDLFNRGIKCGQCHDAEYWHRNRWVQRLPQMNYISYWQVVRPLRVDEIKQIKYDPRIGE